MLTDQLFPILSLVYTNNYQLEGPIKYIDETIKERKIGQKSPQIKVDTLFH